MFEIEKKDKPVRRTNLSGQIRNTLLGAPYQTVESMLKFISESPMIPWDRIPDLGSGIPDHYFFKF